MIFSQSLAAQAALAFLAIAPQTSALPDPKAAARADPATPASITRPPSAPRAESTPNCSMYQDPDHGDEGGCRCDGVDGTFPQVCSTGADCDPCHYTTTPTKGATPAPAAFTSTDTGNGDVWSCASAYTENAAVNTEASCGGSSKVVSTVSSYYESYTASIASASAAEPTTTVQIGQSKISVGNMNGQNLTDAIVKSLQGLCPNPSGSCNKGSKPFESWYDVDNGDMDYGNVDVTVKQSSYTNSDQLNAFIAAIAFSFNSTATGDNCKQQETKAQCKYSPMDKCDDGTQVQCSSSNFASAQILHVVDGGAREEAQMSVELSYGKENPETWNCGNLLGILSLSVGMIPGGGLVTGSIADVLGATSFVCTGES